MQVPAHSWDAISRNEEVMGLRRRQKKAENGTQEKISHHRGGNIFLRIL